MESIIRLFKAVEISSKRTKKVPKTLLAKTIKHGFVFSPEVVYNYSESELNRITGIVAKEIGLTSSQMNSSFHKSWQKIKEASIEQLVIEQIMHYITTYGFELLGCYNETTVYVPVEKLEIPELDIDRIYLTVIKGYKKEEIKEKALNILKSGIALKESTMDDLVDVLEYTGLNLSDVDIVKNKEVKVMLCDIFNLFPSVPAEFLRYLIYKATGKTLVIKNDGLINSIREGNLKGIGTLLRRYDSAYGYNRLAEIFLRFKPLFLAFRVSTSVRPIINKIRRLAVENHKPMQVDYLNNVTAAIKQDFIDGRLLDEHLSDVSIFRKIRLAYALNYRVGHSGANIVPFLYRIRNGKSFAKETSIGKSRITREVLKVVLDFIADDLRSRLEGKKIYIPKHIQYALPATEKQFTGYYPSGTCVAVPRDMIFGIHWTNTSSHRVDLDLSTMDMGGTKYGWDGYYRDPERGILFSGDMTDAPSDGATELFYIKRQVETKLLLNVNFYNYVPDCEVPMDIIVAQEQASNMERNYMVNPNNIKAIAKTSIKDIQKILGLVVCTTKECRFYFCETSIGRSITARDNEYTRQAREYLSSFYQNTISLSKMLVRAGVVLVDSKEKADIDLSPEVIEKDAIIKLLVG